MDEFVESLISPVEPDFEAMRVAVVEESSGRPSVGDSSDVSADLMALRRSFIGQPEILFAHASMVVLLRREMATGTVFRHFRALWTSHSDLLLELLDREGLLAACSAFGAFSDKPDEARTAALVALVMTTAGLCETERLYQGTPRTLDPGPTPPASTEPEDGPGTLLRVLDQSLDQASPVDRIAREVVSRALSADGVLARAGGSEHPEGQALQFPIQPIEPRAPRPPTARGAAFARGPSYLLVNDTSRRSAGFHLGPLYACHSIRRNLAERGLTEAGWANDVAGFRAFIDGCRAVPELLVLNGEGTLHHQAPRAKELLDVCRIAKALGMKVAIINTVWEANDDDMASVLREADAVHVRDMPSRAALPSDVPAQVTPDVSIPVFAELCRSAVWPSPAHDLGVMDSVVPNVSDGLLRLAEARHLPFFAMPAGNLNRMRQEAGARSGPAWPRLLQLADLVSAEAWLTGRFHGLIGALCAGRPVCALGSNTAKIEGLLGDLGLAAECLLDDAWLSKDGPDRWDDLERRLGMQRDPAFIARREAALRLACNRIGEMFDRIAGLV